MSVHWGFYCKDCNAESNRWFEDPRQLRQIYAQAGQNFQKVWGDLPLRLPKMEIEPLFFLAQHYGHELWVQCELAQLKLGSVAEAASAEDEEECRPPDLPLPAATSGPPSSFELAET